MATERGVGTPEKKAFREYLDSLLGKYATGDVQKDLYVLREILAGKDDDTLRELGDRAVRAGYLVEKQEAFGKPGHVQILGGAERKAAIQSFKTELTRDAQMLNNPEGIADYGETFGASLGTLGLDLQLVWDEFFRSVQGAGPNEKIVYSVAAPPAPETNEPVADSEFTGEVPTVGSGLGESPSTGPTDSTEAAAARRGGAPVETATGDTVTPAAPPSGGGTGGGGGGGAPATDAEPGGPKTIPATMELWKVENAYYLVDTVPGTNTPLVWQVENAERLEHIYGTRTPDIDRELTRAEWRGLSPWRGGLSAEIQNTDKEPWQQFLSDFEAAAEFRPWIKDDDFKAIIAVAYLEGREPTDDELASTDWWQNHTAEERGWMKDSATLGKKEVQRRKNDTVREVEQALKDAGMANPSKGVIDYVARQRLTGKWSESYTTQQMRKLADPYAAGTLDRGLFAVLRDPDMGSPADAAAIAGGTDTLRERIRDIFEGARIPLDTHSDGTKVDPEERLNRMAEEVLSGARTMSSIRQSVDLLAMKTEGGRPGGMDVTREGEDRVQQLAVEWLGPQVGQLPEGEIARWAGDIRNDPDAEQEFIEYLQQQRLALLPGYTNKNLTYNAIISPVRNLATNIWGQHVDDESMLVDLANMQDYTEMSKRLRKQGLEKGVGKVVDDALEGLSSTAFGQQVIRSTV